MPRPTDRLPARTCDREHRANPLAEHPAHPDANANSAAGTSGPDLNPPPDREPPTAPRPRYTPRQIALPAAAATALAVLAVICLFPSLGPILGRHHGPAVPATAASGTPSTPASAADPTESLSSPTAPAASSTPTRSAPGTSIPLTPEATADQPTPSTPADVLAGPVDDQVLQTLLTRSLPADRTITDPTLLNSSEGQALIGTAWRALDEDLHAGGWSSDRQQAVAVMRTGKSTQQGFPIVVDVVFMWAATDPDGQTTERELSKVRMNRGGGSWSMTDITTASGEG